MSCHLWKRGVIITVEPFKYKNVYLRTSTYQKKELCKICFEARHCRLIWHLASNTLVWKEGTSFRIIRKTRAIHCNSVRRKSTPKWLTVIALANNGNDIFLSSLVLLQQHWILISPWDQQEVTESQAYLCFGLELWGKGWGGDEEVWSWSSCLVWKHMPQGARLAE